MVTTVLPRLPNLRVSVHLFKRLRRDNQKDLALKARDNTRSDHLRYLLWLHFGMQSCGHEVSSPNGSRIRPATELFFISFNNKTQALICNTALVSAVAVERGALTSCREKKVEFKSKYKYYINCSTPVDRARIYIKTSTSYVSFCIRVPNEATSPWTIGSSC